MTKKIFSLILAISVVLCTFAAISPVMAANNETAVSVWDGNLTGILSDGTGVTEWFNSQKGNTVIEIYEARQLAFIAYMSSRDSYANWDNAATTFSGKTIKLMTDIDLDNKQWLPICFASGQAFLGTFDGNGYKIKNLYGANLTALSGKTPDAFGLIGTLAGTVKNLVIENVTYDLDLSVVTKPKAGAICGNGGYYTGNGSGITATIENCAVKNVTFNVTNSATFSANNLYGLAAICGCGYRVDFKDTYVNGVAFNFASEVSNFQYGGFNNINKAYRQTAFENCYLANATQSIGGAAATDLKWGYVYTDSNVSVKLCYTTSDTTESAYIPTGDSSNKLITAAAAARIEYGMTTSNTSGSYIEDTANKNGGFPLLAIEVPVRDLKITKDDYTFTASAEFAYPDKEPKLFLAAYDKDTNMLVFAKSTDEESLSEEFLDYDAEKHIIKAFVWRLADCTPFVESVTYTE